MRNASIIQKYRAAILLSAYGKSYYLPSQVKSIAEQMSSADILVIVDDGSALVEWDCIYSLLPPNYIIWSRIKNIGSSLSFIDLLVDSQWDDAKYYFLSDQDDVWLDGKIEKQTVLTPAEKISVHAVIEDWEVIEKGALSKKCIFPVQRQSSIHYFFETPAPGMTMCIGAQFREKLKQHQGSLRKAAASLPHDRIIAACSGWSDALVNIGEPLVSYRQHQSNLIGAAAKTDIVSTSARRLKRMTAIVQQVKASKELLRTWTYQSTGSERGELLSFAKRVRQKTNENLLMHLLIWMCR